jgi:hypothetical protein
LLRTRVGVSTLSDVGQIVKQVGEGTTRYYWYPGDRGDWLRAGLAVGSGFAVGALLL